MNNYTFLNLSYIEFEELVKDIFETKFNIDLESFSEGVDEGVDIRYFAHSKNQLIIQCKRYSNFNDLIKVVRKEKLKVISLNPVKYILATSYNLTIKQKEKIYLILKEVIKTKSQIVGNKDLNGYLRKNHSVEDRHFKLWIQGTTVLKRILKSKIINQSSIELKFIQNILSRYVENPSFTRGQLILKENNFLLISGIPGIGKTTLARMLSYYYLSKLKYKEFIYLSNSIDEGFELYSEDSSQVFFFDDFLGQSFGERKLSRNEDKRLLDFVKQIQSSSNKILILTTREYILRDVQSEHSLLNSQILEISKCILDISSYHELIKARILYNHLYFSKLPKIHVLEFCENSKYYKIIGHSNFNPRIIDNLIDLFNIKKSINVSFYEKLIKSLDAPYEVWDTPFTKQINLYSQFVLLIMLTMNTQVYYTDLSDVISVFANSTKEKYGLTHDSIKFKENIRQLMDTFLKSEKDDHGVILLSFHDPSLPDYLISYLKNNRDILYDILNNAIYFEQLFYIISAKETYYTKYNYKIISDETINNIIISKIQNEYDSLKECRFYWFNYNNPKRKFLSKRKDSEFEKLITILNKLESNINEDLKLFLLNRYILYFDITNQSLTFSSMGSYIDLAKYFESDLKFDKIEFVKKVLTKIHTFYDIEYTLPKLVEIFPTESKELIDEEFKNRIINIVDEHLDGEEDSSAEIILNTVNDLETILDTNFSDSIKKLNEKIERVSEDLASKDTSNMTLFKTTTSDDTTIESMFQSLKYY